MSHLEVKTNNATILYTESDIHPQRGLAGRNGCSNARRRWDSWCVLSKEGKEKVKHLLKSAVN